MSLAENILLVLEGHGPSSRDYLTILLEKPRSTIYDELYKLEKKKKVSRFNRKEARRGRPIVLWKIGEGNYYD